jgi:hypothetical protein
MRIRLLIAIFLLGSFCCFGQQQQPRKVTLSGNVALQDGLNTSGKLTVTIEGKKLRGSASYSVPIQAYRYVSMVDTYECELDKDDFIEGTAVRKIRESIVEVKAQGAEHVVAYVDFQEIGRFQGRYKDGNLEVDGRFFKLDRNAKYEIADPERAKLPLEAFRSTFDVQADRIQFFKWFLPKKEK